MHAEKEEREGEADQCNRNHVPSRLVLLSWEESRQSKNEYQGDCQSRNRKVTLPLRCSVCDQSLVQCLTKHAAGLHTKAVDHGYYYVERHRLYFCPSLIPQHTTRDRISAALPVDETSFTQTTPGPPGQNNSSFGRT